MGWLHKMATSTQVPEPTLTPLENDVWTTDSILQMIRSKRDTDEGSDPIRDKRFIFLGWLAFDQLKKELKESVPRKPTKSLQKREVETREEEDSERSKRFLSAWMILDFIRSSLVKKPTSTPLPEPVAQSHPRTLTNTTSSNPREKRSADAWVDYMMDWLNPALLGTQTLLTKLTNSTPDPTVRNHSTAVQSFQLWMDYLNEEEGQSTEPQVDYSYDAYVLVLVFGIALLAIASTLAMYLYGEYKESLLHQETNTCTVEIVEIALSTWTIASDVSEDSRLDTSLPDYYAALEYLERP
jgi:hypothetical protein